MSKRSHSEEDEALVTQHAKNIITENRPLGTKNIRQAHLVVPEESVYTTYDTRSPCTSRQIQEGNNNMSTRVANSSYEVDGIYAKLFTSQMQNTCHLVCLRRLGEQEVIAVAEFLNTLGHNKLDVVDAIFYLEAHLWNLEVAVFECIQDNTDRDYYRGITNHDESFLPKYNRDMDRKPAMVGTAFERSKLRIKISQDSRNKQIKVYEFAELDFNHQSQASIHKLNAWRRKIFREQLGPGVEYKLRSHIGARETETKFDRTDNTDLFNSPVMSKDVDWHPLEDTYVASRYAIVDVMAKPDPSLPDRPRPQYNLITSDHNSVFSGRWLPGRVLELIPSRTEQAISGHLGKAHINPRDKEKKRSKMGLRDRHFEAQNEIKTARTAAWGETWPLEHGKPVLAREQWDTSQAADIKVINIVLLTDVEMATATKITTYDTARSKGMASTTNTPVRTEADQPMSSAAQAPINTNNRETQPQSKFTPSDLEALSKKSATSPPAIANNVTAPAGEARPTTLASTFAAAENEEHERALMIEATRMGGVSQEDKEEIMEYVRRAVEENGRRANEDGR